MVIRAVRTEMEKRDLSDLWNYSRFGRKLKDHYGLNYKSHIRYDENRGVRCLVYVIRRSKPTDGFSIGNFAIDDGTLRWVIRQQGNGPRTPKLVDVGYVALVEDFGGMIVNYDTAKNVRHMLDDVAPFYNDSGGQYYWVNEDFHPFESPGTGPVLNEPPF